MNNNDNCECCDGKTTTSSCLNCVEFKVNSATTELEEFLEFNKDTLNEFMFFINKKYYEQIKNGLKFNLDTLDTIINITDLLEDNVVCVVIDKKKLDWGDFNL